MEYTSSVILNAPIEKIFSFCSSKEGFLSHFPYRCRWKTGCSKWEYGTDFSFEFRYLGVWFTHSAKISGFTQNEYFEDTMQRGLYKYFVHQHIFEPHGVGVKYTDKVIFSLGFGDLADRTVGLKTMEKLFSSRHKRMKEILEANPIATFSNLTREN